MMSLWLVACGPPQGGGGEAGGRGSVIQTKGSDTMVNAAQALAEEYHKVHPEVAVAVSGGGSGTGIAALENGTTDVANASREIHPDEVERIRARTGKEPTQHRVAFDALAVYVHKDNPAPGLSKEQLEAIYGEGGAVDKWSQLGITVPGCPDDSIVRVSRQNNSGTYEFFREFLMDKADFKSGSLDMQGSKDVVDLVHRTPCAIGYSGLGYATAEVRVLCVSVAEGGPCVAPSTATVLDHSYPISRGLYMYTPGEPRPEVSAYLDWVKGDAGQALMERSGLIPLPAAERSKSP